MSINIVPTHNHLSQVRNTDAVPAAPSAPGLVDTLRANGPVSVASRINNRHPIESRVANWEENQQQMQMETRRRMFGIADPMKREMELSLVQQSDCLRPAVLGGSSNVHHDILANKDWSVDWEDIYKDHTATATAATAATGTNTVHQHFEQLLLK